MKKLKIGILNDFRRFFTDPANRGTSTTDTFNGNGSTTAFSLTNTSVMFVSSVTVNSVAQKLNRDYYLDFGRGTTLAKVTFITPPGVGTNNVSITYKYGDNWIYPGTPQTENRQLPRLGILRVGGGTSSAGVGETQIFQNVSMRVGIWVRNGDTYTLSGEVFTGDKLLDFIEEDIENKIVQMKRDYDEPYNVINIEIGNVVDIPFDEEFKLNRREMTINILAQKTIS